MKPLEDILDESKTTFFSNIIFALKPYFSELRGMISFYNPSNYEDFLNLRRKKPF